MRTRIMLLCGLAALISLFGCGSYGKLLRDWEGYDGSAYYRSQLHPEPSTEIPPMGPSADFKAEVAKLKAMRAEWEKVLESPEASPTFYTPDPDSLKTLGTAVTDPAVAERVLKDGFSLQDAETLALLRNPGVKEAESGFRATLETYNQIWNLDEILRQYTAFTEALMTGVGPMKGREPIAMKFPFPGVLALKGEVVTQEVKASRETLEIARRTAVTQARKAYWNLLYVRSAQTITGEMLGLLNRLERVASTRYETGKTSFQDLIKIRIEREILDVDLKTLREEQRNVEVRLLEILDLPPTARLGAPAAREPYRRMPDLDNLYVEALEKKQELLRLRARVGKMERMIEMAETAIYPVYSLNFSIFEDEAVSQVGTGREKEPFPVTTTASVGAGLPKMPWYGKNDAYLRETRQRLSALRDELKKVEDATLFAVREAWFRLDRANREEALYAREVVKLSRAALDVSTQGYETGKVTFADVIASYTMWLKANLFQEKKRSDLGVARAELQEAVGALW